MRGWWKRRSLRARLTFLASGALAVGLVVGSLVLAAAVTRSRVGAVSATAIARADTLAALVTADRLPEVLPANAGEVAQVLDAQGRVLAATSTASRTLPVLDQEELSRLPRGEAKTRRDSPFTAGPVQLVAVDAQLRGGPVTVVVTEPLADVVATLRALRAILVVAVPLLVLVVGTTCWLLVGSALRPVAALRRGADAVTGLGGSGPLPVPSGGDEVAALAVTLNSMLARLDAAGARQRAFIADAAHELRSPLASLRTQLEVAASVGENAETADLLADVLRLGRLVDDLLVLARLDAPRAARPPVLLDLVELALAAGGSQLAVQGEGHAVGEPEALRRVVANLVDNARRHAAARVLVTVAPGRLDVDDDGPGVPAAQRERIFERFTRLDDARARDAGGSGLGLAIARETARVAGGDVTLGESPLGGARFTLTLPADQ